MRTVPDHPWVGSAADPSGYPTVQRPELFEPDWRGFYMEAPRRTDAVRADAVFDRCTYGDADDQQVVNVLRSPRTTDGPVVVYFHGGRWREGHPDYYDWIARPWIDRGAVFMTCGYRKEPRFTLDDAIDDAVSAIAWAHRHAREHGGDPRRLYVVGHSSGGHVAAMATLTDWSPPRARTPVAGLVCQSAPIDMIRTGRTPEEARRWDPSLRAERHPDEVVLAYGDPELQRRGEPGTAYKDHAQRLAAALRGIGCDPREVVLPNSDHLTVAKALADPDGRLFDAVSELVFGADRGDGGTVRAGP